MLRFICFLLGKEYETCKSCETLKQQLMIANQEKQILTNTLLDIVKPKIFEAQPVELNQIAQSSALFSRRRAALEQRDREEAKILIEKKHLGVPDKLREVSPVPITGANSVESLEKQLGVEEKEA